MLFVLLAMLLLDPSMATGASPENAYLDSIQFGDEKSEQQHQMKTEGDTRHELLAVEMGSLAGRYPARTVKGKGASVSLTLRGTEGGRPLLVEVQEVHNRRPDAFGYTVLVNDREVYFRTYEEYGAGPNHYFVQVDPVGAGPVKVTFRSEGGAPFSLGKLWAYDNFFAGVAEREQIYRKMGLILSGELLKKPEQVQAYEGLQCYAPIGRLGFNGYGLGGLQQDRKALAEKTRLSAESRTPYLILLNGTGWGGKPNGPDGLGGYFSDPRYSLLQYHCATGRYQPSWPGMWGNTPTPTLRDPVMNDLLEKRFARTLSNLPDQLAFLKATGTPAQLMLIREFAPVSGEISNFTIEKARRDGVALDPSDGLGWDERLWMHRDAVRTWQDFADSTVRAIGRDAVLVDCGEVRLPGEQLLDNLYAHPDFLGDWPANDPRWSGGQVGMVDGLWSSGEMGRGTEYRDVAMYDYLRAGGKLAMINMERTILKENFSVLKSHYQRGFQFLTLFNAYENDARFVKQVDGIDAEPALPAVHREPTVLDLKFWQTLSPGPVDSIDNLDVQHDLRLAVQDCSRPGQVTYRLGNVRETFAAALNLHLNGRISPGDRNHIEIFAGETPDKLCKVADLTEKQLPNPDHWTPWMTSETSVDLGRAMIGKKEYFLRLVFHAAGAPDATMLVQVHVGTQWPRQSGYLTGNPLTARQSRITQLWVQDRALAARWLAKYKQLGGEDATYRQATALFGRGWYRSAHRLLSGEVSQLLPARYVVRGYGRLGRYPVEVRLPGTNDVVLVTLHKLRNGESELSVASERPSKVQVTGNNAELLAPNRFRVTGSGTVQLDVQTTPDNQPVLPRTLVARCLGFRGSLQVDFQEPKLMGYDESISLPVAKNATRSRRADTPGAATTNDGPQPMDQVELTLNEQGQVVDIKATYGVERGRIKAFHPPVLVGTLSNGEIEMESGNRYALHYDKKTGTMFDTVALHAQVLNYEIPHLAAALKPGQEIELAYCPYREKGGLPRIRAVKQPQKALLDVDYTKTTGAEWKEKTTSVEGIDVKLHKPEPNYLTKVELRLLRPTEAFVPGSVVYRIENDRPLATTAVEFTARAFEDSSRVEFLVSDDGKRWVKCGQFDNTWQNNISQQLKDLPSQFVDLTPAVQGKTSFYLKVQLAVNSADDRFCVGRLKVLTEGVFPPKDIETKAAPGRNAP
jgi:hypothetical protein